MSTSGQRSPLPSLKLRLRVKEWRLRSSGRMRISWMQFHLRISNEDALPEGSECYLPVHILDTFGRIYGVCWRGYREAKS